MDAKVEVSKKNWFQRHKIWTAIIALFLFVSIVNGISTGGKGIKTDTPQPSEQNVAIPSTTEQRQTSPVVATAPQNEVVAPIKVSPNELYNAYQNNELAADEKYKNKVLEVSGTISSIGKDIMGSKFIALKTSNIINVVQCMISDSESEKITTLNKGQTVTVVGTEGGAALGNVILNECKII